jgi:Zn-dependent peptidase ImmA (M78 family)
MIMATDLSNVDSFFSNAPQLQTLPVCEEQFYSCNFDDNINQIFGKANDLKIEREPLDIRCVVEEIFKIKIDETDLGKDISGFLERIGSKWHIYINKHESELRKRFTIAHELGHFIFHRNQYLSDSKPDQIFFRDENTNLVEWQANEFAAKLLMPKDTFGKYIKNGCNTIAQLADKFKVSTSAIKYRAYKLGYLTEY